MSGGQAPGESDVARAYSREPAVEAQIRRLADVPRARLAKVALARGSDPMREETLVHVIRRCHKNGDADIVAELLEGLVRRINPKVARTIAVWQLGSPPSLADEVIDEIIMDFYDQVLTDDESTLFWEIRFWLCLERRLLNTVRQRARERDRLTELDGDADEDGESITYSEPAALAWDYSPETQALVAEALAQLPELWRRAFMLKHWAGCAIEGGADDRDTITAIMGLSGKTVRKYIGRAQNRIAAWRIGINKVK